MATTSSSYTDPSMVQPGLAGGGSSVGSTAIASSTGGMGMGVGVGTGSSGGGHTTSSSTATPSSYGSRGKRVPFAGGAEPRGVDSVGKKLGLAAFSLFLPPAAVAAKTGDVCETGLNMGLCLLGFFPGVIHAYIVSFSKARASCMTCGTILEAPGGPDLAVRYPVQRRHSVTTTGQMKDKHTRDSAATSSVPQQQIAVA